MIANKITQTQYDDLKNSYLNKNRTMHSLYVEINKEIRISKHLFFELINKIRQEEGLNDYYSLGKQKKKNSIIENLDKSPNHYN
ncbi:hypothetical protein TL18_08645 [Methanobrevibacter sp. YE315]|uniref:hypothetical protein n=1 Tax=Methanobrevibacter sp. YE315 TaxID=1609968 RepID=UPI000764D1E0|nr:hypothetical protein [Methanobrevibacter sp. YE315]AMD18079.1 hypothetical protein TL18_08645 [Methanobrevibacter sp. YE315]